MKTISRTLLTLGATLAVAAPTSTAMAAAPADEAQTTRATVAAPAFTVVRSIGVIPRRNLITGAKGTIRDRTSGNDRVAVQTFIQRKDRGGWRTVVTGPRKVGNNVATSSIGARRCTNGKSYRAKVNWNWNNRARGTSYTRAVVC